MTTALDIFLSYNREDQARACVSRVNQTVLIWTIIWSTYVPGKTGAFCRACPCFRSQKSIDRTGAPR